MTPTKLDPADYWRLRSLTSDLEREQTTALLVQTRLELARERRQTLWTTIAAKYGVAMDRPYALQDESCSLIEQTPPPSAVERDTSGNVVEEK